MIAGVRAGVFLSIRANVRPPSSQCISTMLTFSPTFFYSTPASVSIPLQLFLEITFDRILSFSTHVPSLKIKFFLCLKALRYMSAFSWIPLRSPSLAVRNSYNWPFHRRFYLGDPVSNCLAHQRSSTHEHTPTCRIRRLY